MNEQLKVLERQAADDLARSLVHSPHNWRWHDGERYVVCGPNGIRLSASSLTIYSPLKVHFGFWNRRRIRRALRQWTAIAGNELADKDHRMALIALRQSLSNQLRAVA